MKPSELLYVHRDSVRKILANRHFLNPCLFGSASRQQDSETSDLDILVEAPPDVSLFDLAAAEIELEQLLGCRIDVVTDGLLSPDVRRRIDADLQPLP